MAGDLRGTAMFVGGVGDVCLAQHAHQVLDGDGLETRSNVGACGVQLSLGHGRGIGRRQLLLDELAHGALKPRKREVAAAY